MLNNCTLFGWCRCVCSRVFAHYRCPALGIFLFGKFVCVEWKNKVKMLDTAPATKFYLKLFTQPWWVSFILMCIFDLASTKKKRKKCAHANFLSILFAFVSLPFSSARSTRSVQVASKIDRMIERNGKQTNQIKITCFVCIWGGYFHFDIENAFTRFGRILFFCYFFKW